MTTLFFSYARGDDVDPFDSATSSVGWLHRDLTARGFEVWFDRMAMPSRGLTFHQEIQDAAAARERLVLVVGPKAAVSDYVRQEWQFALHADKAITPVRRQGDYPLFPDELKLLYCEDFRDDAQHVFHLGRVALLQVANHVGRATAWPLWDKQCSWLLDVGTRIDGRRHCLRSALSSRRKTTQLPPTASRDTI